MTSTITETAVEIQKQFQARLQTLTINHGRHTFISHAMAGGRTLAEVRDAAGHSNVSITSGPRKLHRHEVGEIALPPEYLLRDRDFSRNSRTLGLPEALRLTSGS